MTCIFLWWRTPTYFCQAIRCMRGGTLTHIHRWSRACCLLLAFWLIWWSEGMLYLCIFLSFVGTDLSLPLIGSIWLATWRYSMILCFCRKDRIREKYGGLTFFHYFLIIKLIIRLSQTSDENWYGLSKKTKTEKRTIFSIYERSDFNIYLRHNIINVKGQRRTKPRLRGNSASLCTTVSIKSATVKVSDPEANSSKGFYTYLISGSDELG